MADHKLLVASVFFVGWIALYAVAWWFARGRQERRWLSFVVGLVAAVTAMNLVVAGRARDAVNRFQDLHGGCPTDHSSEKVIFAVGLVGVAAHLVGVVLLMRHRRWMSATLVSAATAPFAAVTAYSWFVASFCFVF
ncbi:hypothetical protein [Calidifontibacter terrae]